MDVTRILLADAQTLFRHGVRALLDAEPDLEVVGEASDGEQAVALADVLQPDVVIIDVKLPRISGSEAAEVICDRNPDVRVLAVTAQDGGACVLTMLEAGATGYLLKDVGADVLVDSVRRLVGGESVLDPSIAGVVLDRVRVGDDEDCHHFSDPEVQVLRLAAVGHRNQDIAQLLGVSQRTVQLRLSQVFEKLQVSSRTEAVVRGLRDGLFRLDEVT